MSGVLKTWLPQELERRGWSYRELARRAGISQALVSRILSGDVQPSADFCIKTAEALGEPLEKLLRLAGILPEISSDDATLQELMDLARNMSLEDREELLKYARFRFQQGQDN